MSNPTAVAGASAVLDPRKRVRYVTGLVLGVDELNQEQLYFLSRHRDHGRALHGYGTACGLRVRVQVGGAGAEVRVEPGTAVLPTGDTVHVTRAQCARLDEWLAKNAAEASSRAGSPPGSLTLYVVLGYRECATDPVLLPGPSCRTQEESTVASRIAEDFELALAFDPPAAAEHESVRRLGELLARVRLGDDPAEFVDPEAFLDLVRGLGDEASPPDGSLLPLDPALAEGLVRAAFRVWITEVRPLVADDEQRLLLARLDFDVADDGSGRLTVDGAVEVDEDERPVLLPASLIHQGWVPPALAAAQVLAASEGPVAETPAIAARRIRKTTPKKAAPKMAAPKKPAPKKTASKKPAPKKTAPKKTAPKKTAPKKPAPKKASRKTPKKPSGEGVES